MSHYSYAIEKFNRAIYTLSTSEGDVRDRLCSAFSDELLMIEPRHLPEKLQADFEWCLKQLTKYDETWDGQKEYFKTDNGKWDHILPSKIQATCLRIKRKTGSDVAKKIFHIWQVLNEQN